MRHLSAGDEGDPARGAHDRGRHAMSETALPLLDAPEQGSASPSRRTVLKAGGALIIGFSLAGEAASAPAAAPARGTLAGPPDPQQIDTYRRSRRQHRDGVFRQVRA